MRSRQDSRTLRNKVKGLMIESYLIEGSQKISENIYGKSITDPCLGWEDSEKLVLDLAEYV
jgi:3-deoxy-7-phosphoheptulonate synthase